MRHFRFAAALVAAFALLASAAMGSSTSVRYNYGPELYKTARLVCVEGLKPGDAAAGRQAAEGETYDLLAAAYKAATGRTLPTAAEQSAAFCEGPVQEESRKAKFGYKTFFKKLAQHTCIWKHDRTPRRGAAVKEFSVIWGRIAAGVKRAGGSPATFKKSTANC